MRNILLTLILITSFNKLHSQDIVIYEDKNDIRGTHQIITTKNQLKSQYEGEWIIQSGSKFEKVVFIGNKVCFFEAVRGRLVNMGEYNLKYLNERDEKINEYNGKWSTTKNKNYVETDVKKYGDPYYTFEIHDGKLHEEFSRKIQMYDDEYKKLSMDDLAYRRHVESKTYSRKVKYGYNPFNKNTSDLSDGFYDSIRH